MAKKKENPLSAQVLLRSASGEAPSLKTMLLAQAMRMNRPE